MTLSEQLRDYINAAFSGLWIETFEPQQAEEEVEQLCQEEHWDFARWDIAAGVTWPAAGAAVQADPVAVLNDVPSKSNGLNTLVLVLHNFHRFLQNPVLVQKTINTLLQGKQHRWFLVVVSPVVSIPVELEKLFVVLEHQLPDAAALAEIAQGVVPKDRDDDLPFGADTIAAAAGLTHHEAEGAFSLSLTRTGAFCPDAVWEIKAQQLKKTNTLTLHRGEESFAQIGGLDALKQFCTQALAPARPVRPKGVLLLGVPGTGKSAFAKALGKETGRPTLVLDVGALMGALVGQSEENTRRALRVADAMSPCVLFVDEIEKALSGVGGERSDGGVSSRLFGTLLTWLNDHTSDVFFIGTCNDVSKLPPEFSRAERFDGIFFIDLPTQDERCDIWAMYLQHFGLGVPADARHLPADSNWTGAEIKACCRLAALLDCDLHQAARNVVPVATTAADKVSALRQWASGRCLSASAPGVYNHQPVNGTARRRTINAKG